MVKIFTKNGFREESYAHGFQVQVSRAFIEKHGKEKTEAICRQIILHFKEEPERVPSFESQKQHTLSIDSQTREVLKALGEQRGLSVLSLVRESLHCHLLKKVEPVRVTPTKVVSFQLRLSPFEEKLLNQWKEMNDCSTAAYFPALACVTRPLPHADLAALSPRQALYLYPDYALLGQFLHSVRVYGYLAAPLCRQILAFLDRPFDKGRVQDRYLDWLTGGYASTLSSERRRLCRK